MSSSRLFSGVKVFLDDKSLDSDQVSSISQTIKREGGVVVKTLSKNPTHIVTNDEKYDRKHEAVLVNSAWIEDSVTMKKLAAEHLYDPTNKKILAGVIVTTTNIPANETLVKVQIMIEELGGKYTSDFSENVTHLIAYSVPVEGESKDKYNMAKERKKYIVSHEWLNQCAIQRKRVDESKYTLLPEKDCNDARLRDLFNGLVFIIDGSHFAPDYKILETMSHDIVDVTTGIIQLIQTMGGQVVNKFDPNYITHVVCRYCQGKLYRLGIQHKKQVVTPHWIDDCIRTGTVINPETNTAEYGNTIHVPLPNANSTLLMGKTISVTGFIGAERNDLIYLIKNMGGTYTGNLTKSNTHLIGLKASLENNKKFEKAIEWGIPILKKDWIIDCVKKWRVVPLFQKYFWIPEKQRNLSVQEKPSQENNSTSTTPAVKKQRLENGNVKVTAESSKKKKYESIDEDEQPRKVKKIEEKIFLFGNGLEKERKEFIELNLSGCKVLDICNGYENCTHVIMKELKRTEKFFCSLAAGIWVLQPSYIYACVRARRLVDEKEYEWYQDSSITSTTANSTKELWLGGPRYWREQHEMKGPVFANKTVFIYLAGNTSLQEVLKKVIIVGGGNPVICTTSSKPSEKDLNQASFALVGLELKKGDKILKLFNQYGVTIYEAGMLLDKFTLKPPLAIDNYKIEG
jgi:hypothetical protein